MRSIRKKYSTFIISDEVAYATDLINIYLLSGLISRFQ